MRAKKVRMRARALMSACVRLYHPSLYLKPPAFVAPFASRTSDLPQGNALTAPQDCRNCDALPTRYSDRKTIFVFGGLTLLPADFECTHKRTRALTHTYTQAHSWAA